VRSLRFGIAAVLATLACAGGGGPRSLTATSPAIDLPAPAAIARPQRVLLVSIHALTPDRYLAPDTTMPVLASLAQGGVAAYAVEPVFAPAPYPAHTSLVTGVAPAKHGVAAEFRIDAQGVDRARRFEAADLGAAPLWQVVAQQGGTVASLDWPATQGAAIADLAPDLVVPAGASWVDALGSQGAGRAAEFARRAGGADPATASPGAARDASLVTMACGLLVAAPAPTFVMLRLSQTQVATDASGPDAESTHAAFAAADAELGRLVRCLGDAGLLATTGIAVAGDHGVLPVHTEIRANVALADAGLVVPAGSGTRSWDAIARSNGGSAFVYAGSDESALLARRALEAAANETGAFRVLSASDMVERGADPEAWFGVQAEPGYAFADAATGAVLTPASFASAGGYAASDASMATGFVAWGPGLRSGLRVAGLRGTDVAPTLARWLGVQLGVVEGRPMVGWFAPVVAPAVPMPLSVPPVEN
jgi:predicted AlkP superfamily pyrophosphatase or phosphodiesterase